MPGSMLNSTAGSTMNPRRGIFTLFVLLSISVRLASASATLLLEEPYGKLGFFTATGHAAVYLSDVCAETPLILRPCARGELGAVISRYDGVGGYDWIAIPLIPYLYAVEKPEQIPLFVDGKVVNFLRDQYRRNHLEAIAPDLDGGQTPSGNWYELVGSAYDRASFGFEIETSNDQDRAFIRSYNSAPNVSHFHIVSRNCADFAKDVINFYYPKALHRSVVADLGMTTPKQMAKTLVKFSTRHSELQFTRYVIPQVPGIEARSSAVHGVVESFLKSKKYFVPSIAASPIFAGCVAAVYVGSGAGRFHPGRNAPIFDAEAGLSPPIGEEDRRSYQTELNHLLTIEMAQTGLTVEKDLERTMSSGAPGFDSLGRPVLRMEINDESETLGVAKGNVLAIASSGQIAQRLLEARLHEELRKGESPKVSAGNVERDWKLLQAAFSGFDDRAAKPLFGASPAVGQTRLEVAGNRP